MILSAVRRTAQGRASRGDASTVRGPEVGYDPMEKFRPPSDRQQP